MFARQISCFRHQLPAKSRSKCLQNVKNSRRYFYVVARSGSFNCLSNLTPKNQDTIPVIGAAFTRHFSTENVITQTTTVRKVNAADTIDSIPIPDLPLPDESMDVIPSIVNTVAELQSLGLGSWVWPSGWVQNFLYYMHLTFNMPWWACIASATIAIRLLLFPIVVNLRRYTANMYNTMPREQEIQADLAEARKYGDELEIAALSHELVQYSKKNNRSPLKAMAMPLIQAPIFVSFFFGLRGMARAPVETFKDGGMLWFVDLTAMDPYLALPFITSTTLLLTIELGTDSARADSMSPTMKWIMRSMPIVVFPFMYKFEAAILCYWASSNFFSLASAGFLKIPQVQEFFKIPKIIQHDKSKLPMSKKSFKQGISETWTNWRVARQVHARSQYDQEVFDEAGRGPIPRTFKSNPLLKQGSKASRVARRG